MGAEIYHFNSKSYQIIDTVVRVNPKTFETIRRITLDWSTDIDTDDVNAMLVGVRDRLIKHGYNPTVIQIGNDTDQDTRDREAPKRNIVSTLPAGIEYIL